MLITRAPVRISFGGGGTDMPGYFDRFGGAVLNTAVNHYFYTICTPREDNKIQIISSDFQSLWAVDDFYGLKFGYGFDIPAAVIKHFRVFNGFNLFMASEIPPGSGLGSSGAVTVNIIQMCAKMKGEDLTPRQIAEDAYFIQRETLSLPIGKQDEYASAFGGLNFIEFTASGTEVAPVKMSPDALKQLEKNVLLFFTGQTRKASSILQGQSDSLKKSDAQVTEAMDQIKRVAYQMKEVLEKEDLNGFGNLLDEVWQHKKKMNQSISNNDLDAVYELAKSKGAMGGKITGAGGGGYFIFYCEEQYQQDLTEAMIERGMRPLDFKFAEKGVEVLVEE